MKLNSHIIFLIVIVGIITAGVVGATLLNNGTMKQVDFDGIKVNVPSDSDFIKTADGYADTKYGISIHTFKDNTSIINYLNNANNAQVISLKNQPPQSVAFTQGEDTNVLVTNSAEAICIGAKDQSLVTDMSNSIVFSNHQKSVKPQHTIPLISEPPHMDLDVDFNFMQIILAKVNNHQFNLELYNANVTNTINEFNNASQQGTLDQYTSDEFVENTTSNTAVVNNNNNTSLLENSEVNDIVQSISSDGDGAVDSGNGADSAASSISSDSSGSSSSVSSSSADSAPSDSTTSSDSDSAQDKLTEKEIKEIVKQDYPDAEIKKVKDKGSYYLIILKNSNKELKYSYDGNFIGYED